MRSRLPTLISFALAGCLVIAATPASGAPEAPESEPGYRAVSLERRGLSLRDDVELSDIEPERVEMAPAGGGGAEEKNPALALVMSAVLPGWGQLYTGHTSRAKGFIAAEAAIWLGYGVFTVQGNLRQDDFKDYAREFAGVRANAGDQYWDDVSDFIRSEGYDSYNEAIRSDARSLYPDDLEAQRRYFAANGYFGELAWEWEDIDRFVEFRHRKHSAAVSFRSAFFMSGLAILNRAISAIDSAWMARRHNRGIVDEPAVRLSISPDVSDGSLGARAAIEITF